MKKEEFEKISEKESKKPLKKILGLIFFLFIVLLLEIYWFLPFREIEFNVASSGNANFSLNNSELVEMQFYNNMRYSSSIISYKIVDCTLRRKNDMERAIDILENETILRFYPVEKNEEITITCSDEIKHGEYPNHFIAGEGGPTEIISLKDFTLITSGKVLLLRDSGCSEPNVGLHELLHALGFEHSSNKNNIMYPITECYQTLGDDIPSLINELYSYPAYSDLELENASAFLHSRYLDLNFTVKNNGFVDSEDAKIVVYINNKSVENYEIEKIGPGEGKIISIINLKISELNVKEIELSIEHNYPELDKKNNNIKLKTKSD